MVRGIAVCVVLLSVSASSWAINKCTGLDGKTIFQDAPCAGKGEKIDVRPASGSAPVLTQSPTSAQGARPASTKEGAFGESWQRRTYLENRGIPDAEVAVQAHRKGCEQKQADLRARQGSANNNLAGATYLQSLATEMQAAATMCDARARELNVELDSMKKELRELQVKQ